MKYINPINKLLGRLDSLYKSKLELSCKSTGNECNSYVAL